MNLLPSPAQARKFPQNSGDSHIHFYTYLVNYKVDFNDTRLTKQNTFVIPSHFLLYCSGHAAGSLFPVTCLLLPVLRISWPLAWSPVPIKSPIDVTEDGWHALSCLKSAGRFSRHSNLNALIKQSLSSTHIQSVLEPRHLYRTDQKRPDCLTLVPWADGKQLLWNVTVVDSLAPCRINAGSVCNPGTAAAEAEERKIDKYKDLVNDGYLFQPLAFEIQGAAGPSTEVFLSKLCKNLSICTEEPRAGSFLKQRISLAIQIANAACVLGTINDKITFDENSKDFD